MKIHIMKSTRSTDVLPWILVGLSAVIMGVAVGVYSSDASATDTVANESGPSLMDATGLGARGEGASSVRAPGPGSALYGPAQDAAEHATVPQPHSAQL